MIRYRQTQKLRGSSYLQDSALSASAKGLLTILDLDERVLWSEDELDALLPIKRPAVEPYLEELVDKGYLVREDG